MSAIPRIKADESTDEMARLLGEAGCLVVTDAFDADTRAGIEQAMRPHLDALPAEWIEIDDPEAFEWMSQLRYYWCQPGITENVCPHPPAQ